MALTYTTTDFYRDMNNLMSSVQRPTPPNMTLIPNSSKPNTMQSLAPTTKGDMTVLGTDGAPMSVPEGTPLYTLNKISSPTVKTTTPTTPAETAVQDLSEIKNAVQRNFGYDVWAKMRGLDSKDPQNYEKYLERAGQAKVGSAILTGVGSLLDVQNARMYRKDVEKTSSQYEAQKKIIDTNIDKTESALMENLMSNMADLDTMMAAKNVDLTSQSIAGDKAPVTFAIS